MKPPSLHSNVVTYHRLFPASGVPGVNIVAAKVAPYFNQRFPPKSFSIVTLSGLLLFPCLPCLVGKLHEADLPNITLN